MTLQRVADLRLRSSTGPTRTRVWWPFLPEPGQADGLLLFLVDARLGEDSVGWLRELATRARIVIVAAPCATDRGVCRSLPDATTALEWAADHTGELDADPARLLVGGNGIGADLATAAAAHAAAAGWPLLERRILLPTGPPDGASRPGIAPATVVTFGDALWQHADDVERLHYADASDPSLVADLARSLAASPVAATVAS
jgi:acetyl esterase/lipase